MQSLNFQTHIGRVFAGGPSHRSDGEQVVVCIGGVVVGRVVVLGGGVVVVVIISQHMSNRF